ncbi:ATP-binding protein [Aurantimonas sp. MSK8Z-1]|uniref:ATP-binding protein n=1 Tax=Mangrovibrevibacter kandeliae TaxID=2968473 RepID=UPI0021197CA0|nr:ATP-binding protein [Aurantimonas sp. MSK8Z-1]MCW4114291.1 ATP-binding protein [Aurantimonas sp. MSK8Z-1]
MSLRRCLFLLFATFAVALIAAMALIAHLVTSAALEQGVQRQLSQAADQMSERLDFHMYERLNDIVQAAALPHLFTPGREDSQRRYLESLQREDTNYAWIGYAGLDGKVIVSTGGLLEGADVSQREWFAAGRRAPVGLDVHEAKLLQKYLAPPDAEMLRFVDVAAPVYDVDGNLSGVLAAHLSWSWADDVRRQVLNTVPSLDLSDLLITADNGTVILGPRSLLDTRLDPKDPAYVSASSRTRGFRSFAGLGWSVVARQPVETALAPVRRAEAVIMVSGIALVILSGFLGRFIASLIARPLQRLATSAGSGLLGRDAAATPAAGTYREARTLASALNEAFERVRRSEHELRRTNECLEDRVSTRTRQLEDAKQKAEAAMQAKTDFLATMSHEIRSPLNAILGFADLILDVPDLKTDVRRRVQLIQTAGSALTTVIDDVLDWSKIEAGRVEICDAPFDLHTLVLTCVAMMEPRATGKGLSLVCTFGDVPQHVSGDEGRLRQILLNLLNNAVKFTSAGGVEINVRRRLSGSADALTLEVADTGLGMSPEQLEMLFKRFSQADSSIGRRFGGSGLGLAISQQLAVMMGGRIEVSSELGRGSRFLLTLDLPASAAPQSARAVPSSGTGGHKTGHVLLVEDLAINREIATAMLEAGGHRVTQAVCGHQALAAFENGRFDLILMDIQMPGMDGVAATRALRERERERGVRPTPILALTANVLCEEVERFRGAGMDDVIAKPIKRDCLLATLQVWLPETAAGSDGEPTAAPSPEAAPDLQFDSETYGEMLEVLGPARIDRAFEELRAMVATLERLGRDRDAALPEAAHRLISSAGAIGFTGLALACRELERACKTQGGDVEAALQTVLEACSRALARMRLLSNALAGDVRAGSEAPAAVSAGPGR